MNKIEYSLHFKPNRSLSLVYYSKACSDLTGPSPRHCDRRQHSEEMSKRWQAVGNNVSGGFRGGGMGGCIPPTSLKVTILAEKSASISNNSAPVRDASPPTNLNLTNPAEKSLSILVKTFFFFSFWRPPNFGRKRRLNFRFRPKNHSQFR